jgi:hypothetical protein
MASLRLFLAISLAMDLDLCQLDIDTAFLYAPIIEDVYIRQPLGFANEIAKVSHLERMYCLKQPPVISTLSYGTGWSITGGGNA